MSDPDRGYRKEGERPLSFDARQPVRGERAVPVAFLISAGILIVLIVAVVVAYRGGVRGADQAPGAIGESVGDMKTPAPADAQPVDPAAGLQIYNDEKGATTPPDQAGAPGFAPPPEQPQPRAQAPGAPPTPAPAASTPAATAAQPSGPVAARPSNSPPLAAPTTTAPTRAATPPTTTPGPAPARAATPSATPPAPARAAPAAPAAQAAPGPVSAQVGAFSSSALADRGWADAVRLAPGAAVGKGKSIEEAQVNGRTVYRALVTGFESRSAAVAFCATVSAAGGNCLVR